MTLQEAIVALARAKLTDTNNWYQWAINPDFLPTDVVLPKGNPYAQNVALKAQLSKLYSTPDDCIRQEITEYYIAKWGGIRRNSTENIRAYALDTPASLIARGSQGIASWSKALCIRCPAEYAIYDARVALSMNCLQITRQVNPPMRFPLLSSRNKLVTLGNKIVRRHTTDHRWPVARESDFYPQYNSLLSCAALYIGTDLYTLEMLLFAKAPELLKEAFSNEGF